MGNFEEAARHFGAVLLRTAKTLVQSFYFATRGVFKAVPVFAWLPIVVIGAWAAAPALASITGLDRVPDGVSSVDRFAGRAVDTDPTGSVPSPSPSNSASYAAVTPQATGGDFGAGGIGGGSFGGGSSSGPSAKKHGSTPGGEEARSDPSAFGYDANGNRTDGHHPAPRNGTFGTEQGGEEARGDPVGFGRHDRPGQEGFADNRAGFNESPGERFAPGERGGPMGAQNSPPPPPPHPAMNPATAVVAGVGGLIGGLLGVHAMRPGAPGQRVVGPHYAGNTHPVFHATGSYHR